MRIVRPARQEEVKGYLSFFETRFSENGERMMVGEILVAEGSGSRIVQFESKSESLIDHFFAHGTLDPVTVNGTMKQRSWNGPNGWVSKNVLHMESCHHPDHTIT